MFKSYRKIVVGSALLFGVAATQADDLIVTHGLAKGGAVASIDLSTSGSASAFEFQLQVPKGVKSVDVSKCVAEIPKSHEAKCVLRDGIIHGMVYSLANERLPAGVISVGQVKMVGASARLTAIEVLVADDQAQKIEAKSMIE
jgi:hypothetical protein